MGTPIPYKRTSPIGVPGGMLSFNASARVNKGYASAPIAYGLAICYDATGGLTPIDTGSLVFAGFALTTRIGQSSGDSYATGDLVSFGEDYHVCVTLTGTVAAVVGNPVYRVAATGAITADSTGNTLIENCTFTHAATTGELTGVRLAKVS